LLVFLKIENEKVILGDFRKLKKDLKILENIRAILVGPVPD